MAQQNWVNLLNFGIPWQTTSGTQLSASATTATISPQAATGQDFVLPGQSNGLQWYPGMTLRIAARGTCGSGGTASNLTVWLAVGVSGTLATTLCTTPAFALGAGSVSGMSWEFIGSISCSAIGSTGNTLVSNGNLVINVTAAPAIAAAAAIMVRMPNVATAFNTYTAATAIGMRASLSAAFGNIQCDNFDVYQIC